MQIATGGWMTNARRKTILLLFVVKSISTTYADIFVDVAWKWIVDAEKVYERERERERELRESGAALERYSTEMILVVKRESEV